jgi:cyanophycinase-like exopeptidase
MQGQVVDGHEEACRQLGKVVSVISESGLARQRLGLNASSHLSIVVLLRLKVPVL